jgi:predicted peptidase
MNPGWRWVLLQASCLWGCLLPSGAQTGVITNAPAGGWSSLHSVEGPQGTVHWQLFSPADTQAAQRLPLVIWLHGGAMSSGQPDTQTPAIFTSSAVQARFPCYLLVPCAIQGRNWVNEAGRRVFQASDLQARPTASMILVMALLDRLLAERPIDPRRLVMGGASGGGYGTWAFLHAWPDRFAAAFPISGGGDPARVDRLDAVRIWMFHGEHDKVVPVARAHAMLNAMLLHQGLSAGIGETADMWMRGSSGGHLRLTVYRAGRHNAVVYQRALNEPDFMEWLFSGSR